MDVLGGCGWKNCRQENTTIYYGIVGFCDKHSEEWFDKEEAFYGVPKLIKPLLKLCSPEIRKHYKDKSNE